MRARNADWVVGRRGPGGGQARWTVTSAAQVQSGTHCTSWATPSYESSAPTSSFGWCGPARPSLRTPCSSGSPWSSNRKRDHRNVRIKKPDYKVAYVQLAHGQTFTFPDLFPEKKQSEGSTAVDEDIQDKFLEEQRERQRHDPRRGGVPNWFGL
ncbi:large ribosomal subunit protein uL23m isoform X3 [Equus asinus]|uniref:39S ribosomal protein L23, mitochondrial n=2 Tax=Equus TaxID=9789 RepID=A0A9L0IVT9_EQUAS